MPTFRQKVAVKKLSDSIRSGKPKTMKCVLTESGYSKTVAKRPKLVTEGKGWKELLEQEFPDELLLQVHEQLLQKKEMLKNSDGDYEDTGQPHSDVKGALEMIYKLKGKYEPEKVNNEPIVIVLKSTADLRERNHM